ncbi:MAG: glycosyltransferase [Butyrivibrio sp.]|nr:glycosyltransferase [Butyrivibrio sp.]
MDGNFEACFELLKKNIRLNRFCYSLYTEKYLNEILVTAVEAKDPGLSREVAERLVCLAGTAAGEVAVVLCFSALGLCKDEKILRSLLEYTYEYRDNIGPDSAYDIFQQTSNITFRFPETDSLEVLDLKNRIYQWVLVQYKEVLKELLTTIPAKERKEDFVVVITQQLLEYQHGPTKQALCKSKALMDAGYKVLLINTAEIMPNVSTLRITGKTYSGYIETYLEKDALDWDGVRIPFFQCEHNMPNYEVISQLLKVIRDLKPAFAVSIASGTVFEGLLSELIPVLGIPMSQSDVVISGATCQIHTGNKNKNYEKYLEILGLDDSRIIESEFSFSLTEQKEFRTRKELNIDEDAFLMVVAGGRIADELDDKFWDMMRKALKSVEGSKLMVMGNYNRFDELSDISEYLIPVGFVNDSQSYFELCDLFINPHRKGGGTGCVEALSKGVPVVTDPYGDVAANAGDVFCVSGYEEFLQVIEKYSRDKEFYKSQSELAKKRAEYLLNADDTFIKAVKEFIQRIK